MSKSAKIAVCDRCKKQIEVTPDQIGTNIGKHRVLCTECYEWEHKPTFSQ